MNHKPQNDDLRPYRMLGLPLLGLMGLIGLVGIVLTVAIKLLM